MHIGKHIREVMIRQGVSVIQLAEAIHCERANVYNIFKRESIDTDILIRICKALNYDFFKDISNEVFKKKDSSPIFHYTVDFSS
ncbi:MAG: helix-turn-helix transcriptional regulator [Bacteroidales bacterium]|nr:helix-turn-helix transcriptional regulator [Bacteroidales bacterium]